MTPLKDTPNFQNGSKQLEKIRNTYYLTKTIKKARKGILSRLLHMSFIVSLACITSSLITPITHTHAGIIPLSISAQRLQDHHSSYTKIQHLLQMKEHQRIATEAKNPSKKQQTNARINRQAHHYQSRLLHP